ncbi:hypothetical protein BKA63DRAFT_15372 [Paraphoma chrysanthemicola]|nr:hypothetical protein BKA63DRAFT_15372 [Paraphoma chrysanthemicola]
MGSYNKLSHLAQLAGITVAPYTTALYLLSDGNFVHAIPLGALSRCIVHATITHPSPHADSTGSKSYFLSFPSPYIVLFIANDESYIQVACFCDLSSNQSSRQQTTGGLIPRPLTHHAVTRDHVRNTNFPIAPIQARETQASFHAIWHMCEDDGPITSNKKHISSSQIADQPNPKLSRRSNSNLLNNKLSCAHTHGTKKK